MGESSEITKKTSSEQAEYDYFAFNPAPAGISTHIASAKSFIQLHASSSSRPVALITSGGTTVPLENQTVRFIDNFSAGTRGAASAEYFLRNGYAVVFLHREFSLLPFARHYSHSRNCFLDLLSEDGGEAATTGSGSGHSKRGDNNISIRQEYARDMRKVLREYNACKDEGTLLQIPFVTITEYLWLLRELAKLMHPLGARAAFYLAAAVSDFFVPAQKMVEHKIQSGAEFESSGSQHQQEAARMQNSRLVIDLDPVPKFLRSLVDSWAPQSMIISFKLETDPSILTSKAVGALKKYSHHLVIGNLLKTRKWEVVFVYNAAETGLLGDSESDEVEGEQGVAERWIRVPRMRRVASSGGALELVGRAQNVEKDESILEDDNELDEERGEPIVEIESLIIPQIKRLHMHFIKKKEKDGKHL